MEVDQYVKGHFIPVSIFSFIHVNIYEVVTKLQVPCNMLGIHHKIKEIIFVNMELSRRKSPTKGKKKYAIHYKLW